MGYFDEKFELNYFRPDDKVKSALRADLINKLYDNDTKGLRDYLNLVEVGKTLRDLFEKNKSDFERPDTPQADFLTIGYRSQGDYRREDDKSIEAYPHADHARDTAEYYYKNITAMNLARELSELYEQDAEKRQKMAQSLFQAQKDLGFQIAQRETAYLQDGWNQKSILSKNLAIAASLRAQDFFRNGQKGKMETSLKVLPHLDRQISGNSWLKTEQGFNVNGRWWENQNSPASFNLALKLYHHKNGSTPDPQIMNFGYRMDAFQTSMPKGFYKHLQDGIQNIDMAQRVGSVRLVEIAQKNLHTLGAIAKDYDHSRGFESGQRGSLGQLLKEQMQVYDGLARSTDNRQAAFLSASFALLNKGYSQSDPQLKIAVAKDDPYNAIVDPLLDRSLGQIEQDRIGLDEGDEDRHIYAPFSPKPPAWMMATMWDAYKAEQSLRGAMAEFSENMNSSTYEGGQVMEKARSEIDISNPYFKTYLKQKEEEGDPAVKVENTSLVQKITQGGSQLTKAQSYEALQMQDKSLLDVEQKAMMLTLLHHDKGEMDVVRSGLQRAGDLHNLRIEENALNTIEQEDGAIEAITKLREFQGNRRQALEETQDIEPGSIELGSIAKPSPDQNKDKGIVKDTPQLSSSSLPVDI